MTKPTRKAAMTTVWMLKGPSGHLYPHSADREDKAVVRKWARMVLILSALMGPNAKPTEDKRTIIGSELNWCPFCGHRARTA